MKTESRGRELGSYLVKRIEDGTFKKNHLPNHGDDFTHGSEELLVYKMNRYMGSCGHAMMEKRLENKECVYFG